VPAPLTNVAIVNRALARFGGGVVATMEDATPPGPAVALQYQTTIDELLGGYDWTFCKETVALNRLADEAPGTDGRLAAGWLYAHALPAQRLKLPSKYLRNPRFENDPVTRISVHADRVYSDEKDLWAVVQLRADESVWPAYFTATAVACLAADLIMAISGNASLRDQLTVEAYGTPSEQRRGGMVQRAQSIDAANSGTKSIGIDAFMDNARLG
jgi:hypothetical protein